MKIFNSQKVKKLHILWKQAIAQKTHRGINLKTFIMHYLLSINSFIGLEYIAIQDFIMAKK